MQEAGKKRLHIKASGLNWKSHDYVPESEIYPPENCTTGLESRQMCGCKDNREQERDLSDWVNDNVANTVEHKHTHREWRVEWQQGLGQNERYHGRTGACVLSSL